VNFLTEVFMNIKIHKYRMVNEYILSSIELFGVRMKKINYKFDCCKTNSPTKFIKIVIHHVGNKKTIQEIIDLHVKKNKWATIGYHFLIDKSGKIYYSRELKYAGAHTFGLNRHSIGIALFGNFDEESPTQKQIDSLNRLVEGIRKNYEIRRVLGHNQAVYELILKKFWQLKLPVINPLGFQTKKDFAKFMKEITTRVLEFDSSEDTVRLLKRLKTCPGQNMYKVVLKLQKGY